MAASVKRTSPKSGLASQVDAEALEFCALTQRAIDELLDRRTTQASRGRAACRRQAQRWPFPGTVELWLSNECGQDRYLLATSINLSHEGIGIQTEEDIAAQTPVQIAIHEPEVTFHGRAVVRHCTPCENGEYVLGLQFVFDDKAA